MGGHRDLCVCVCLFFCLRERECVCVCVCVCIWGNIRQKKNRIYDIQYMCPSKTFWIYGYGKCWISQNLLLTCNVTCHVIFYPQIKRKNWRITFWSNKNKNSLPQNQKIKKVKKNFFLLKQNVNWFWNIKIFIQILFIIFINLQHQI